MPKKKVNKVKRAKAGKAKKEGKQESKSDKESDVEKAKANAALWELRLKVTDQSLAECREASRKLARANDELIKELQRAQREALDVTGFMMTKDEEGQEKINMLQKNLKLQDALAREEQNKLVSDYTLQINEMKELFRKRSKDFNTIQDGMKTIQEFQTTKAQMEQELQDIRERMKAADKEHREHLNEMECKLFNEKNLLEKEVQETLRRVVAKTHTEAIAQLDDTSRSVFKENVRLNAALKHHVKEAKDLQVLKESMSKEIDTLTVDKDTLESLVKRNTSQIAAQKQEISRLKAKVASLEETNVTDGERGGEEDAVAVRTEVETLKTALSTRERELGHVRRLARALVDQRRDLEEFFHEALAQVRREIEASRLRYKTEAQQAYRRTLRDATAGRTKFPPIRTFNKSSQSTNSVYKDMEVAATWTHPPGSRVELSELTWEQRERVLRLLFAKMNGQRERKLGRHFAASPSEEKTSLIGIKAEISEPTFITQETETSEPNPRPT